MSAPTDGHYFRQHHDHLTSHIIHSNQMNTDNTLHVVGVISNPVRYHSRYRIFREWYKAMKATPNVRVYVVEIAFGDRLHEVTDAADLDHLQLRSSHEVWHKEAMINLAVRHRLPVNWKYMCWCDCDIFFADRAWAMESIQQLQHYEVIQPWATCLDMGFAGQGLQLFQSFCSLVAKGVTLQTQPGQPYQYPHSGFAWACTRKFWENIKGLIDWCLVGSADHHMAWGMINRIHHSVHQGMTDNFKRLAGEWARQAYRITHGNLGFVNTHIEHKFHGSKRKRQYRERWQMFIEHKFDPTKDIMWDEQGLPFIINKPALEEDIRKYNRFRNEDSTDE